MKDQDLVQDWDLGLVLVMVRDLALGKVRD